MSDPNPAAAAATFEHGLETMIKQASLTEEQARRVREYVSATDADQFSASFGEWLTKAAEAANQLTENFEKFAAEHKLTPEQAATVWGRFIEKTSGLADMIGGRVGNAIDTAGQAIGQQMDAHPQLGAGVARTLGWGGLGGLLGAGVGAMAPMRDDQSRMAAILGGAGRGALMGGVGGAGVSAVHAAQAAMQPPPAM